MNFQKRIYIMGVSGSGKSFLAKKLSKKHNIPCFDLDDVFWKKKYTQKRSKEDCEKMLSKLMSNDKSWIIEGVFSSFVKEAISNANEVIWLNTSTTLSCWRVFARYITFKGKRKESLREIISLMRFVIGYKRKNGMYFKHKDLLKNCKNYVIIKNKKQLNEYLRNRK